MKTVLSTQMLNNLPQSTPQPLVISEAEFERTRNLFHEKTGIYLVESKITLVAGRLLRRLRLLNFATLSAYLDYIESDSDPTELDFFVHALTTHETWFFREPAHFEFFYHWLKENNRPLKIWSAACSTGEEVWSLAMTMIEAGHESKSQLFGTDIDVYSLDTAAKGEYTLEDAESIPEAFLKKYCLKKKSGSTFAINNFVRSFVSFCRVNLDQDFEYTWRDFDCIIIRNVMIYLKSEKRAEVMERIQAVLKPGGILITGHAESSQGFLQKLKVIRPSIYQKT